MVYGNPINPASYLKNLKDYEKDLIIYDDAGDPNRV